MTDDYESHSPEQLLAALTARNEGITALGGVPAMTEQQATAGDMAPSIEALAGYVRAADAHLARLQRALS